MWLWEIRDPPSSPSPSPSSPSPSIIIIRRSTTTAIIEGFSPSCVNTRLTRDRSPDYPIETPETPIFMMMPVVTILRIMKMVKSTNIIINIDIFRCIFMVYLHDGVSLHNIEDHGDGEVDKYFYWCLSMHLAGRLWQTFYVLVVNWRSGDTSWLVACNLKLIGKSQLGRSRWSSSSSPASLISSPSLSHIISYHDHHHHIHELQHHESWWCVVIWN